MMLRILQSKSKCSAFQAQHVYRRPKFDANAIPNTPANFGSLPLAVDLENAVSVSTDTKSCALSVPFSIHAGECVLSVSGDCASLEPLSADFESSASTMQFSEDHQYCALSVPGNCASSPLLSVVIQACAPTMLFSIDPLHSLSPLPPAADHRNRTLTAAVSVNYRKSASTVPDSMGHGNFASSLQSSFHSPISDIDPSPMNFSPLL